MHRFGIGALLALALSAAACERPESIDPPAGAAPAASGSSADAAGEPTAGCASPGEGYAVQYPASWHANPGTVLGPCSLFHPEPFEVPRDSEVPIDIAVMLDVEPVPFTALTGDVLGRREMSRQRVVVGGRDAVRIEGETTGEGLHPPGIRMYEYFVDLGGRTLIAATYDAGPVPFERKRRVLDAMMSSLELGPAP